MVDVFVGNKEVVTPADTDTVVGVQDGAVKRFTVGALKASAIADIGDFEEGVTTVLGSKVVQGQNMEITQDPVTGALTFNAAAAAEGGATAGPVHRGPLRLVSLGDSNTQGSGNTPWSGSHEALVSRANGKILGVKNAGISGQDCAAIMNRVVVDVLAYEADLVVAQMGTNNTYQASVILPYLDNLAKLILGNTKETVLVICSTYPSTTGTYPALAQQIEDLVASFNSPRVLYAPTHEALGDATTGYMKAEYADDDTVHTGDAGGLAVADCILGVISHLLTNVSPLEVPKLPTSSSTFNPILNNRMETGNISNFTLSGSVTGEYVASDPGIRGGYGRFTFTGAGAEVRVTPNSSFNIKEWRGRRAYLSGRIRIPSASASSYLLQLQTAVMAGMLSGYDLGGSFTGLNNVTRFAGRNEWNFFYLEFDIRNDAVFSTTSQTLLYIASLTGGDVVVDVTDLNFGIVGHARSGYRRAPVNVRYDVNKTLTGESIVRFDCANGARTLTLPSYAEAIGPIEVIRTDATSNVLTVTPASGTINGQTSVTIEGQLTKKTFYPDTSSNWIML